MREDTLLGNTYLWMWNSATLRYMVSPLRKASFDSNSFTVYPNRVLLMSCAWTPSRAPSKTPTIVPMKGFVSRMALLSQQYMGFKRLLSYRHRTVLACYGGMQRSFQKVRRYVKAS